MRKFYHFDRKFQLDLYPRRNPDILKLFMFLLITIMSSNFMLTDVYGKSAGLITNDQQQIRISGTIVDESGNPLPGVNVIVRGTTVGAITDVEGKYSLAVPDRNAVLVASFIGYVSTEVPVGNRNQVDITLASEALSLEEVVVVGYGTQKKVNVIGSVTTIDSENITAAPVNNVSNALAGRLPGVIIKQASGLPGADEATIRIRGLNSLGDNSALVVVDGIAGRDLNSIAPGDIESLTVLKDASAGIYGSRAANGVILVTTKRGVESAPLFEYSFYHGWETPTLLPEMTDAPTYAQLIREVEGYRGVAEANMMFSLEDIEKYKSGEYPWTHPNSDWFDAAMNKFSNQGQHSFRVTGGSRNIKYFTSFSKQTDNGIYSANATTFDRFNVKANLDITLNKYLMVNLDINGSEENRMYPTKSSSSIFGAMMRNKPTQPAFWPNGLPGPDIEYGDQPVVSSSFETGFDDDKRFRSQNMLTVTFKVPKIEGLTLTGYYAYDIFFRKRKLFAKPVTLYSLDRNSYFAAGNTGKEDGSAFLVGALRGTIAEPRLTDYYYDTRTSTANLKLSYERTFNQVHNVSMFIAAESMDYQNNGINAFRRYYMSDALPYLFAGGNAEKDNGSEVAIDARMNYFGRLTYNYSEKYLFEFTLRRDGSLRFSKESGRWGTFPSVLLGWRVSNEDFWKNNLSFINYFKLKASWGQMGNDAVAAFQYLTSYGFNTGMVLDGGKTYESGLLQSGAPNPNITWEVANVLNTGFESYFFNSKLQFDFDYFYQRRNNILVKRNASVPTFSGISLPDENFGIVDNRGFEAQLGYSDRYASGLSFSVSGNIAFARNKIVEYDEPARNVAWQVRTGHPIGATLMYKFIGVFDDAEDVASYPHVTGARGGDIIIEDYDKDGKITSDDQILFDKTGDPELTYGLNFSLGYKNLQLQGLIQGVGATYRNITFPIMGMDGNYITYYADGRWTEDNKTAAKPRIFMRTEEYWRSNYITDYDYCNLAFARLKNLELSYTIPENITKSVWLKDAQVYISGQNLFLLYNAFKMNQDPELSSTSNYPLMKVYAVGARVAF